MLLPDFRLFTGFPLASNQNKPILSPAHRLSWGSLSPQPLALLTFLFAGFTFAGSFADSGFHVNTVLIPLHHFIHL